MIKDISGKKFSKCEVIELSYVEKGRTYWKCKCECGNIFIRRNDCLNNKSACMDCFKTDKKNKQLIHGLSYSRLYRTHRHMKERCSNPNNKKWNDYGGRGISICDEWLGTDGFLNFYNWALANGYEEDLTLDRIDTNGNYEPSNCRWADYITQGNNTRRNRYFTHNGVTRTFTEWSRVYGINPSSAFSKLSKGYSFEEIFLKNGEIVE